MIKNILFSLAITFVIFSCGTKNNDPAPDNSTIIKKCQLTSSTTNGTKDVDAYYNSNNKLDSISYQDQTVSYKLKYDINNRLVSSKFYSGTTYIGNYHYHYNANGLRDIDSAFTINTSGPPSVYAVTVYTYNASNLISRMDVYETSGPTHTYYTFAYNTDGDITQTNNYDPSGNLVTTTTVMSWDTKAYYSNDLNFSLPFVLHHNPITVLSYKVSNGVATLDPSESYTSTYSYGSDNYPYSETDTYQDNTVSTPHVDNYTYGYICH